MKAHTEMEVQIHAFLISPLDRGECSASRPGRLYRDTYRTRGWVSPGRSGHFVRTQNLLPLPGFEPGFLGYRASSLATTLRRHGCGRKETIKEKEIRQSTEQRET